MLGGVFAAAIVMIGVFIFGTLVLPALLLVVALRLWQKKVRAPGDGYRLLLIFVGTSPVWMVMWMLAADRFRPWRAGAGYYGSWGTLPLTVCTAVALFPPSLLLGFGLARWADDRGMFAAPLIGAALGVFVQYLMELEGVKGMDENFVFSSFFVVLVWMACVIGIGTWRVLRRPALPPAPSSTSS